MMSSPFTHFFDFTIPNALHLAGILVLALICIRLLRAATNRLVKPATTQTKAAQHREQQTRALAESVYGAGSKVIWIAAALTAVPEFGVSALPGVVIAGATILGFSIAARDTIRDAIAGLEIVMEDQFVAGDTIQAADTVGRVEQLTLRRTVVRDARGALVSLSNGELRTVSNLSRDWSQAFVDIGVAAGMPLERTLQALESAAAGLRSGATWSAENFHPTSAEDMMEKYPQGSEENTYIRMVISYWDMVASIVNRGLINDELFFESNGEIWVVWDRLRTIVPTWRAAFKNPRLFSNIEDTYKRLETWREKHAPGSSAAMRNMMAQIMSKPKGS